MELSSRYDEALVWASELHRTQQRKGSGVPYLAHLLAVSGLVLEHGGDEEQAIAGLLHDSIEDQGVTSVEIEERFGKRVACIVRARTDADTVPKPPWLERKTAYIAHVPQMPADALLVSLADKVHNARAVAEDVAREGSAFLNIFRGGVDGTRWYYRRLFEALSERVDELPPDTGHAGGASLLRLFEESLDGFGATPAAATAFEHQA